MRWRWVPWWLRRVNGETAEQATQKAAEALTEAQQLSRKVDRVTASARRLTSHADWFTRDMEQALHTRRGSA